MNPDDGPKWFITGKAGILRGREFVLVATDEITVGRTEENDIAIPEKNVSRHHASLFVQDGICFLKDAGSKNGTYVNGTRVVEMELQAGDIIRIGESEFEVGVEQGNVETHNVRDTLIEKKAEVVERFRAVGSKRVFLYGGAALLVLLMGISVLKPRRKPVPTAPEKTEYALPENRVTPRNATADQILSWQSQANRALQFDDFRGAIPLLRNIVAARPNDTRSKSQLARAEAELAKLISDHFEAGAREFEKYDYDRAIREWRQSVALAEGFDKEIARKAKAKIREAEEKLSK